MSQDFLSSLARPFYVLMAANIAALTAGAIRYMQSPDDRAMLTFVSLWAIVDFFLLLGALGSTFEHRQRRAQPRIRLREPVLVALDNGTVIHGMSEDISATGARINLDAEAVQRADLQPVRSLMLTFPSLGIHLPCSAKVLLDQGSARAGLGCVHLLQTIDQERTAIALAFGSSAHLQERMTRRHRRMSFMRAVAMLLKMAVIRGVGHLGFMVRRQFGRWVNSLPTLMETKQ
jgi:cellulose synthase (UDP-forming)